jgi:hypothetical protein
MDADDRHLYRSCPPVCPAGCTKAVTVARTCSAAHRLRLPIPPPLCRRVTGRRLDRHVAGRPREGRTRSCPATTAMWPAVLTGGRPSFEAAGQLPAGSALVLCRSASGGNIYQIKRPATGRWRTNKRQRVDAAPAAATGSCPNGAGVSCKGRDSVRSTWRGNCRALVEGDLFSCINCQAQNCMKLLLGDDGVQYIA